MRAKHRSPSPAPEREPADDDDAAPGSTAAAGQTGRMRLDKWLWAARFFKTRALAVAEIEHNRVTVNDQAAKPARELRVGDRVAIRSGPWTRTVDVRGLAAVRGPAPVAALLYAETPESIAQRERQAGERRMGVEPAAAFEQGRPTKRDRRQLADWQRWSASADDLDDSR